MVRSSLVNLNFVIAISLAISNISARPKQKDSFLKQLTDAAEEKLLLLIVGFPSESESHVRAGSQLELEHGKEGREDSQAAELLRLLLKSESSVRSISKLKSDNGKEERKDFQAAEMLSQLLEPKSSDLSDASIEFNLRTAALRTDCRKAQNCIKQCVQESCQNTCKAVFDAYDQCGTTTTTRDPCGRQKWGKTLPPHWRSMLRAWKNGDDEYKLVC